MSSPSFRIGNNGDILLLFGRAIEHYLNSLPISYNIRYKVQSRKWVNEAVKQGLVVVERVEGSIDYLGWKTKKGQNKSTNHLDDILRLTENEKCRVQQIHVGNEGNIHVCVRILIEVMLSEVESEFPMHMTIKGNHVLQNIIREATALSQINLSREVRDLAITSHRADNRTTKEIKMKLLATHNGSSQSELEHLYHNQNSICDDIKLRQLIERDNLRAKKNVGPWTIVHELVTSTLRDNGAVLYYQQPDISVPEDSPEHYYQLTLSDNLWLQQACDFGSFCFGIDRKYDLNSDGALILSLVVEDNAGYGTPIVFGLSNKENNHTIRLAIEAVQQIIPCNKIDCMHEYDYIELPNDKGFIRIC
ncbi:gephyrin: PROVISIONAL [Gigaspora margarita]|uniref:Gephyrin: PROVISIONAL n=1 Tax=Gigaspora margarita TaxID=4874 RepID=A0A8H3X7P6_GIGMA|nr:gephyrin: PROVISIONAL [Gigaspora margarita]